jgi:hypothetical protein
MKKNTMNRQYLYYIEKLIFLSAYDKRKFPNGDERKEEISKETWGKLVRELARKKASNSLKEIQLQLIPFESEEKGQSKADWIKANAADFDIVIDDNPNICNSLVEMKRKDETKSEVGAEYENLSEEEKQLLEEGDNVVPFFDEDDLGPPPKTILDEEQNTKITVLAPYYPAIVNQHHENVLLIKQSVSDLKIQSL